MKQLALDIGLAAAATFDTFVVGPHSHLVSHLKATAQAERPGPVPCYIWGASAVGKTHVLQAAHHALVGAGHKVGWFDRHSPCAAVFQDEWAAVILDDVHAYDAHQQHTAFNWFVNALTPASGAPRWVLSAGQLPPVDLPLRDDLRTRLGWGHVFELGLLGEAQLQLVLQQAAHTRGLVLSSDVLSYILQRFSRDLGSLMQLLEQLDRFALQTQRALTIPLVRAMLESE